MNAIVPATQTAVTPPEAIQGAWVSMIERAAKDPSVDLVKLERFLELRAQENARFAAQQYRAAMSVCQAEMGAVRANCANPQTRSRYADLAALDAAIRPVYTAHGFSLSFDTAPSDRENCVRIICKVFHAAGHCETHGIDVPADGIGAKGGQVMTKVHALGSACTYGRRYVAAMIFNIAVERDDDGNAAGQRHSQQASPTPGRHTNGDDNRFYREPAHDPQTGEVTEDHEAREAFINGTRERIRKSTNARELHEWWSSEEQKKARRDFELDKETVADLVAFVTAKINALKTGKAA